MRISTKLDVYKQMLRLYFESENLQPWVFSFKNKVIFSGSMTRPKQRHERDKQIANLSASDYDEFLIYNPKWFFQWKMQREIFYCFIIFWARSVAEWLEHSSPEFTCRSLHVGFVIELIGVGAGFPRVSPVFLWLNFRYTTFSINSSIFIHHRNIGGSPDDVGEVPAT